MRSRLFQLSTTAALVVGLSTAAIPAFAQQAGDFEKGVAAFEIGEYKDAIALWEPLAEQGNVDALRNLAQLHRLGLGVQRDDTKAYDLYLQAAERGSDEAQVNVAFLQLTGKGTEQDREAAATWFAKAADQGNALAQYNLGLMYEKGIGVERDDDFALELYRVAAAQGQKRALARLAALDDEVPTGETLTAQAEETITAEAESEESTTADETPETETAATDATEETAPATTETDDGTEVAEESNAPILSIKPAEPASPTPTANADTDMPAYSSEAEQNERVDTRPIVNVVRTPTRKPGEQVADAPKGDEPIRIDLGEATPETGATDELPPVPVRKLTSGNADGIAVSEAVADAPLPTTPIRDNTDDSAGDTKTPASISTTQMRAPSDPVARVKVAEQAYRNGDFAGAASLLMPLSNAGMPVAQFWMGRMYNRGEGVGLDRAEAYSLWRSAAAGGSEQAATALANLASRLSSEEIAVAEQRHAASGRAR